MADQQEKTIIDQALEAIEDAFNEEEQGAAEGPVAEVIPAITFWQEKDAITGIEPF